MSRVLDLTGDQGKAVLKFKEGASLLLDCEDRVKYLIQVAQGGRSMLNKHGFSAILEDLAREDFNGSIGDLVRMIRDQRGDPRFRSGSSEACFFAAVCWTLEDTIAEDTQLNTIILRFWYDEVVYFGRSLLYQASDYEGTAKKLLRVFAEKCPGDLLDELTVGLDETQDSHFLDALAEGDNKSEGAWLVRKERRVYSKRIEETKSELRSICDLTDPNQEQLDRRRESFARLAVLIRDDEARSFVEEHWPHLATSV